MQKNEKKTSSSHSSINQLTEERATKSNAIEIPSIALPKGGGAIKGIDEKFQVNPSNGTASFSIPLPLSPNRNGFTPSLSISYNSGAGNGILGTGWGLDFPSIQRKTDKRLPRYRDFSDDEDTFMFSGAEDLAPMLERDGENWKKVETSSNDYFVQRFRPRIEGAFSKIERIKAPSGEVYWRVTDRNNITTIFGRNATCRIAHPENPDRIFQWLPEFSFDDKGSVVLFEYKNEDFENLPDTLYNRNRRNADGTPRFINKYLKRIRYGNTAALYPYEGAPSPYDPTQPSATPANWHFELVLDYGEHDAAAPVPEETNVKKWETRPDPFSDYRAGFEIRTCRLLRRVLMFHRFLELNNGAATLVRSLDFQYFTSDSAKTERETELEFLEKITQTGYIKTVSGYSSKSLPPMTFEYQPLVWNHAVKNVGADDLIHAPTGLSGPYQWVDLYNEGIPGILSEQGEAWHYKHNLGEVAETGVASFAPAKLVAPKPSFTGLGQGVLQLQDLDADGGKQIVVNTPDIQGYYDLSDEDEWQSFRPFLQHLHLDLRDPNVRLLDLNGDGKPEVVLTEENAFRWWPGAGRAGYEASERSFKPNDEELGPAIIFSDPEQRIFLADMSGDGLTDIVRIRNGEVCYWPNLGYGHFGAKVTMDNSPWFDAPDQFNSAYLQLADISGTGATDLIYLGKNRFKAYLNLSGNAWGQGEAIEPFFPTEQPNRVAVTDLLGNGTACIVWSSELPAYREAPMRYMDLMGGKKPHIMTRQHNGMGKTTAVEYKSSTWFYLKDKLAGTPWVTRLAFPVQVVAKTVVTDSVTNVRFSAEYSYHHGYYDHAEREFRGFGRVEQIDTESFDVFIQSGASNTVPTEHHQPPVLTKTWFHTGAFLAKDRILDHFKREYWHELFRKNGFTTDALEHELPDAVLLPADNLPGFDVTNLSTDEWREALRACKGMTLRQEVFGLDAEKRIADEKAAKGYANNAPAFLAFQAEARRTEQVPYSVATHNCEIQLLQARAQNRHGVFIVKESEAIAYSYERNPTDPRIAHTLNLETDEYGNLREAVSVVYPRKQQEPLLQDLPGDSEAAKKAKAFARTQQQKQWITFTQNDFTNDLFGPSQHYLRQGWQTKTYELTGFTLPVGRPLFRLSDFKGKIAALSEIEYQAEPTPGMTQKRLIEHVKTKFYNAELTAPLPDGQMALRGIPFEAYQLAYTPNLIADIFKPSAHSVAFSVTEADLLAGRFLKDGDNWWIQSGTVHYRRTEAKYALTGTLDTDFQNVKDRFFAPVAYTDPFDSITKVKYDGLNMFMEKAVDAVGNETQIRRFNFRTLSPDIMQDMNDNISSVIVDELGLVKAAAVEGKAPAPNGLQGAEADNLNGHKEATETTETALIASFFAKANTTAPAVCDYAALEADARQLLGNATARMVYDFSTQPTVVASIAREQHANPQSPLQISFEYTDGLGKVAMKKVQAEAGKVLLPDGTELNTGTQLRWIGNGRTVLNNKGNPIKQYEPYFSTTPAYENDPAWVERGVTPVLYYDGAGRTVRTEMPDGTFTKVVFDAWKSLQYDPNDTISDGKWYRDRMALPDSDPQKHAARQSQVHHNTPTAIITDTLGRPILGIDHNVWIAQEGNNGLRKEEKYYTRTELDIEGNALRLLDARDNPVMQWRYDMLGHRVAQVSAEAGRRWMLNNALGNPVKVWDERNHEFSYEYDPLHRPTHQWLRINTDAEKEIGRTIYGESIANAAQRNLRGQAVVSLGPEGRTEAVAFDFKGNLLESRRQLLADATEHTMDWRTYVAGASSDHLSMEVFVQKTAYDALNRMTRLDNWHLEGRTPSVYTPQYNERGVLLSETLSVRGQVTQAIRKIEYNEKGQRTRIQYGGLLRPDGSSDVVTTTRYQYDPLTFRLTQLRTTRHDYEPNPGFPAFRSNLTNDQVLQQLLYTYDPVGNITEIHDQAYEPVFFQNQKVEPKSTYTYDAIYRLIEAKGRENFRATQEPKGFGKVEDMPQHNFGNQEQALRNYTQRYEYDAVGNFIKMQYIAHVVADQTNAGSWSRYYQTAADSNRLIKTSIGRKITEDEPERIISEADVAYHYDTHGNMLNFSNIEQDKHTRWDYRDMIHTLDLEGGGTAYYQYDAEKQRSRKRIVRNGNEYWERIYLGGYELYRRYQNGRVTEETETHHLFADEQRVLIVEDVFIPSAQQQEGLLYRYQYRNHLGSVGLECDEQARIISYEEYHPYGTTAFQARNGAIRAAAKRYRYTGMERDEESGLAYHTARYYLPWLGRWGSCDPIGVKASLNTYEYSYNNPIKYCDRNGKLPRWLVAAGEYIDQNVEEPLVGIVDGYTGGAMTRTVLPSLGLGQAVNTDSVEYEGGRMTGEAYGEAMLGVMIGTAQGARGLAVLGGTLLAGGAVLEQLPPNVRDWVAVGAFAAAPVLRVGTAVRERVAAAARSNGSFPVRVTPASRAAYRARRQRGGIRIPDPERPQRNSSATETRPSTRRSPAVPVSTPSEERPDVLTHELFRRKVTGPPLTSDSRGFSRDAVSSQTVLESARRHWGGPGPVPDIRQLDLGHATPHVRLRPGEVTTLKAELSTVNRSRGRTVEARMAREMRQRSREAGLDPHDPNNIYFTRRPRRRR